MTTASAADSEIDSKMGGWARHAMWKPCPAPSDVPTINCPSGVQGERTLTLSVNSASPAKDIKLLGVHSS